MNPPAEQSSLRPLVLLLDEALLSLSDKDRTALLLRYYETRSLRQVGAALDLTEDAAQKRVASALERMARFFQRRGYANATTAAAAAALQHTAASAPAWVLSSVSQATAQAAPPVLVGLTALVSRLFGLTKAQMGMLCAAILVLPSAWQWHEFQTAKNQTVRERAGIDSTRAEIELLRTQTDRLRRDSLRLIGAPATQDQIRSEEARRQLGRLKDRVRGLLAASDYRWPDDLPFVRLPKWATRNLTSKTPVLSPSGSIAVWAEELLSLAPEQKQAIESELAQYLRDLDRLADSRAYETNSAHSPKDYTTKAIAVPALGPQGEAIAETLSHNIQAILGSERSRVVLGPISSRDQFLGSELISSPQVFVVGVNKTRQRVTS